MRIFLPAGLWTGWYRWWWGGKKKPKLAHSPMYKVLRSSSSSRWPQCRSITLERIYQSSANNTWAWNFAGRSELQTPWASGLQLDHTYIEIAVYTYERDRHRQTQRSWSNQNVQDMIIFGAESVGVLQMLTAEQQLAAACSSQMIWVFVFLTWELWIYIEWKRELLVLICHSVTCVVICRLCCWICSKWLCVLGMSGFSSEYVFV